jgi:hypothetical protein
MVIVVMAVALLPCVDRVTGERELRTKTAADP